MRLKIKQNAGYSLVELLIGLGLASVIATAAYEVTSKVNLRTVRTVQSIRSAQEANKALDRISSEIGNAFSLNNSTASILGNLVTPGSIGLSCDGITIRSPFSGLNVQMVPHGLVPLPGRTKSDFDTAGELTTVDPKITFTAPLGSLASDGLRIAYIPLDSRPIRIKSYRYMESDYVESPAGENINDYIDIGDFVIIYDAYYRELFRVTSIIQGANGFHVGFSSSLSYWNSNITKSNPFSAGSLLQRVQISSYAHDPETKELFRDDHVKDDGFDSSQKIFLSPKNRVPNWVVLAKNIQSFHISEEITDVTDPTGNKTKTEKNPTAVAARAGCPNEIGYPLFRNALIEVGALAENLHVETFSRKATSKNLTRPAGTGDASQEGQPKILPSATPTATPVGGGPIVSPLPTGTPGRSF